MPSDPCLVFLSCGKSVQGTAPLHSTSDGADNLIDFPVDVTLHSVAPDLRGLDEKVRRVEWRIEAGNRVRDGEVPLARKVTTGSFGMNHRLAGGKKPGSAGLLVGVSFAGFDSDGACIVDLADGFLVQDTGVYLAAAEECGGQADGFSLHDGILLFHAEPRHLRPDPFPYMVFSVTKSR